MTQSPLYESPLLTTELGLSQYLKEEGRGPTSVQALSGGTANYVYRVTWNADATTVICKHAAAFLSSNNNFVFDSARMDYEAHALKHISPLQDQSTTERVHAVQVYEYDPDAKLLTIEDGGKHNLKEAYVDGSLNIQDIACDLATWLATLHMRSRGFSLNLPSESPASGKGNNPIAVAIYRHSYGNLHLALSKFGHDTSLATRVNDEYGSRLAQDNECLVHGDFWPGNVLVQPDVLMDSNGTRHDRLTIVDWEMVRRGTSATDVGQFAAEAFLLDRFRGGRGLRRDFLTRYFSMRKDDSTLGLEWIRRLAVHWAVHIAFWPTRVPWTDEQGTKELVQIGVDVLEAVLQDDMEFVKTSKLFEDVAEGWAEAFERP